MTAVYAVAGVAIVVGLAYIVLLLKLGEGVPPRRAKDEPPAPAPRDRHEGEDRTRRSPRAKSRAGTG